MAFSKGFAKEFAKEFTKEKAALFLDRRNSKGRYHSIVVFQISRVGVERLNFADKTSNAAFRVKFCIFASPERTHTINLRQPDIDAALSG